MRRAHWNLAVEVPALAAFLALLATGLVMEFTLPPGSPSRGLSLLGLNRHQWGYAHSWAAWIFLGLLALHLALHARWALGMFLGPRGCAPSRRGLGWACLALLGLALLAALALPFALSTGFQGPAAAGPGWGRGRMGQGR